MTAYSGIRFSRITAARLTSLSCTSPIPTSRTGMPLAPSTDIKASSLPSSLALTKTPLSCLWKPAMTPWSSAWASCLSFSRPSFASTTRSRVPATAVSKPVATILRPTEPLTERWLAYFGLARVSAMGCGVRRLLMVVTIGPAEPVRTIRSPSRSVPCFKSTSAATPASLLSPALTSKTTHSSSSFCCRRSARSSCDRLASK
mmetsp:Transcript_84518/g.247899  ORF Transcript_84518/g.247899 Transcript_84518/m.247899 type:complete len:202 (-) Transcript_84518:1221-1826(-)